MANDNDLTEAQGEGVWYRWSCPLCGEIMEYEEDRRGQEQNCPNCGEPLYLGETG